MSECSCGKFYNNEEGVTCCQRNGHGTAHDKFGDRHKLTQTIETEIQVSCAECGASIRHRIYEHSGTLLRIDVLPHVCAVDSPDGEAL